MAKGGRGSIRGCLCTTTALYSASLCQPASLAADGISLKLGGYSNTLFSAGLINDSPSRDDPDNSTDYGSTGVWQNAKLRMSGKYEHDNGIEFGAMVEFEIFPFVEDEPYTIEQRFAWVETPLGRVELGSNYSAAYQMHYAAPVVGLPINSGWVTVFIPPNPDSTVVFISPVTSTYLDFGQTENVVTYYTPRIEGFQLGLTYAPAISEIGDGQNFPVEAERLLQYHNGVSIGVNYTKSHEGVDVALATGYRRAEPSKAARRFGADAYQAVSFGINLGYGGVTIGGSYANEIEGEREIDRIRGVLRSTTGQSWDAGISYETGDLLVGASTFHGFIEGAPPGARGFVGSNRKSSMRAAVASFDYTLAQGIHAIGGLMYGRWAAESGAVNTGFIAASGLTFYY